MTEEKRARHRRYTLSKPAFLGPARASSARQHHRRHGHRAGRAQPRQVLLPFQKHGRSCRPCHRRRGPRATGPFCRTCSASLRDRRQPTASKRSSSTTWKGAPCSSNKAAWTHSPLRSSASCSALGRRSYATRARRFPRALRARSRAHRHPRKPARHGYIDIV